MQQQNITKGGRRSTKPTATSKRNSNSSSRGANTTSVNASAARSFRQTAARDEGQPVNRGSKKGNHAQSRRTANPLGDRRTPGAAARNAISKSPGSRASTTRASNKSRTTSNSAKGSSANRGRSRS